MKDRSDAGTTVWEDAVTVEHDLRARRFDLVFTQCPFQEMWDENLGHVKATSHCIEIKSEARQVLQIPYRAGMVEIRTGQAYIPTMLTQGAIEPTTAE